MPGGKNPQKIPIQNIHLKVIPMTEYCWSSLFMSLNLIHG